MKRDKIPVTTMDAAYMIRPGIGYIRLGSFGMTSHKEVSEAMDSLKKKGMKDLIFDLEDNGGGYLQTAAKIANEFLEKGDLIVYTNGRRAPRQEFRAEANGRWRKGKIVVLTNEFTASAKMAVKSVSPLPITIRRAADASRNLIRRATARIMRWILTSDTSMVSLPIRTAFTCPTL